MKKLRFFSFCLGEFVLLALLTSCFEVGLGWSNPHFAYLKITDKNGNSINDVNLSDIIILNDNTELNDFICEIDENFTYNSEKCTVYILKSEIFKNWGINFLKNYYYASNEIFSKINIQITISKDGYKTQTIIVQPESDLKFITLESSSE